MQDEMTHDGKQSDVDVTFALSPQPTPKLPRISPLRNPYPEDYPLGQDLQARHRPLSSSSDLSRSILSRASRRLQHETSDSKPFTISQNRDYQVMAPFTNTPTKEDSSSPQASTSAAPSNVCRASPTAHPGSRGMTALASENEPRKNIMPQRNMGKSVKSALRDMFKRDQEDDKNVTRIEAKHWAEDDY